MRVLRPLLLTVLAVVVPLSLAACGSARGDRDVDTSDAEGGMGKGPGLFSGKRGGIIIYQR